MAAYYADKNNKNNADLEKGNGGQLYPGMMESAQFRWGFIRKIYAILSIQLLITFGVALGMYMTESVGKFLRTPNGPIALIALTVLLFVFCLTMHCLSHLHPWNYIFMFLFTVCMACMVGAVCTLRKGDAVLMAAGLTLLIFLGLTLFTFIAASQGFDFSFLGPFLFCMLLLLMTFGLIRMLFPLSPMWDQIYAFLGALIFSAFIIYDTDNVIKRYDYDQYIEAAACLYMDIINLFLFLLEILDGSR